MLKELQDLLVVQDRDVNIKKLEAELRKIPQDVEGEQGRLKADQATYDEAKKALQEMQVEAGTIRTERRVRQDTVEKLKVQMFETKKNEEYTALGTEVKRYEDIVSDYETQELELLEKCDAQSQLVDKKKAGLEERKVTVTKNITELKDKARTMMERFKEAKVLRIQSAEGVKQEALELYERIWKSKGDLAIAPLKEDVCSGCRIKVVASTLSKVRAADQIAQCENCGRILFEV